MPPTAAGSGSDDQPAAVVVLAFPGLLNFAQRHLLGGNSELTCGSASHELAEGV
jgi:hypothetical protein